MFIPAFNLDGYDLSDRRYYGSVERWIQAVHRYGLDSHQVSTCAKRYYCLNHQVPAVVVLRDDETPTDYHAYRAAGAEWIARTNEDGVL